VLFVARMKPHNLCVFTCALPGSRVHVLRVPAGPLGPAGIEPLLPEEPLTVPPTAAGAGLEIPQLHFHAHWVSLHLATLWTYFKGCARDTIGVENAILKSGTQTRGTAYLRGLGRFMTFERFSEPELVSLRFN